MNHFPRLAGVLLGIATLLIGASCLAATTYTYDNLGRLTGATYTNGTTVSYSYDAAGNRTSRQANVVPSPDLAISKTHYGNFYRGQSAATYTIVVSNVGNAPTNGSTVTVTDTLPIGLTATALTGTGWTCTLATLTCTRTNALAAGQTYPLITLTVNVAGNAAASVINTAQVAGGGDTNAINNSLSDTTTINVTASTNADLASLVLSDGTLSPPFASGTIGYSANVVSGSNTITVTPTVADVSATVTVNSVPVQSGIASGLITLNPGNNGITILVTAQDGVTPKTYTVNVNYFPLSSCTYALSPLDLSNTAAAGGTPSITVTTPAGCPVTAISYQPWVTVNTITPNGGTTTVALQISANAGAARATTIMVAGRLFLITQLAP